MPRRPILRCRESLTSFRLARPVEIIFSLAIAFSSPAARGATETPVGGMLSQDTVWSAEMGTILVESDVQVPAGLTLTLLAGTQVRLAPQRSITAAAGGSISGEGTAGSPVKISAATDPPDSAWMNIGAAGAGASIILRHVDISGGAVMIADGAAGLLEDCYVHDLTQAPARPILISARAASVVVRRCHFARFHETLFRSGRPHIEDSLFEHMSGDAIDFDTTEPGSVILRCTVRHGVQVNADGIDLGESANGVLVEDCLIYDFPFDKGISIGENSHDITVRHCLIYGCNSALALKDECSATFSNNTLADSNFGINLESKFPGLLEGGRATNTFNNILWSNRTPVLLTNNARILVHHTTIEGQAWPGDGNSGADPLFLDAASQDFRLRAESPALGSGFDGADRGARFPAGAPMAASHAAFLPSATAKDPTLRFHADPERNYRIEFTPKLPAAKWHVIANIPPPALPKIISVGLTNAPGFFRLSASPPSSE